MRYVLLIREPQTSATSREENAARAAAFDAFTADMRARGVVLGGERLQPAATTVQIWGGDVLTADGAGAGSQELVTGFCLLDCENLGEAAEIAAKIPAAWHGTIEIRPVT